MDMSIAILEKNGVAVDAIRVVDHDIAFGVYPDMTEQGWGTDDWPQIYEKVKAAEILVLGTPIWLGEKSSVCTQIVERLYAQITALAFIFLLFLLLYKYVPARRIPWRMALTAATFTAICWELLKWGFTFYLTRIADYNSVYGGIATLVVVVIWVYNLSIVFILGAQVAQIHEMRRVRAHQIEVLE